MSTNETMSMSTNETMSTIPIGLFFSKVLVVLGFVTLIVGTLGGFITFLQEDVDVTFGLTMIVSSLVMSSLMIVVGSYVDVRITKIVVDMTPRGIQHQDSSLTGEYGQAFTDSEGQAL